MRTNIVPINAVANGGIFALLAEGFSSLPGRRDARRADLPAPRGDTPVARRLAEAEARNAVLVGRSMYTRHAPRLRGPEGRAIALSGLWSRVGFVGASMLAAGLVLLGDGAASALTAVGLVLGGGVMAVFGWRRAWQVLDGIDSAPAANASASTPAAVGKTLQATR
jgi:hypothetical protein